MVKAPKKAPDPKRPPKRSSTRAFELVFYVIDPKTKTVLGGEKMATTLELSQSAIAGAAMKLRNADAIMKSTEADRLEDQAFRDIVQAAGITVSRIIAQLLKEELHK